MRSLVSLLQDVWDNFETLDKAKKVRRVIWLYALG